MWWHHSRNNLSFSSTLNDDLFLSPSPGGWKSQPPRTWKNLPVNRWWKLSPLITAWLLHPTCHYVYLSKKTKPLCIKPLRCGVLCITAASVSLIFILLNSLWKPLLLHVKSKEILVSNYLFILSLFNYNVRFKLAP